MLQNKYFLNLLIFLLLPLASRLYSLQNCSLDSDDLRKISCYDRKLSEIPSDLPRTATWLDMTYNDIVTLREDGLSGLNQLQKLGLANNRVSDIEPGAFVHSVALRWLSLEFNSLRILTNETFRGLYNLTFLNLDFNEIYFISKFAFEHLENLQELHLRNNINIEISDVVSIVSFCPALQILNLQHVNVTEWESNRFPSPLNISSLDLGGNTLSRFTLHANVLPHLQSLSLDVIRNPLQWDVSDKAFLQNLKTLFLSSCKFGIETYESIFRSVGSIERLFLDESPFKKDLLDLACAIPSLRKLTFRRNALSVINDSLLQSCTKITALDVSMNRLTELSRSSLQRITHLSELDLSFNRLPLVPLTIQNMSSLTRLSLHGNVIFKLDCTDFFGLALLTKLDLRHNKINKLKSCFFKDLHSLTTLYISNNFLELERHFGVTLTNLRVLQAEDSISVLKDGMLKGMARLRELNFGDATIVSNQAFDGLTDLRHLIYYPGVFKSENRAGLDTRAHFFSSHFQHLSSLQTLQIKFPPSLCVTLGKEALQGLGNLTDFSSTSFFCKPHIDLFNNTPRLRNLEMAENSLWKSPDLKLFQPLRDLEKLNLHQNQLKSLDGLAEASLTKLRTLNLGSNELKVITPAVFQSLPALEYLNLTDNPFVCDCSNAEFIQWVTRNKQVYVANAFRYKCAYPPSHEGDLLLDFNVRSCEEYVEFVRFMSSFSLVLFTLLSAFVHHFLRWHLLYGYYLVRAFLYDGRKRRQGCVEVHDAFVSYSAHDEEWVCKELVPELEERQGWRLCLHHRDFEPGKAIVENITDAIYSSRKTLCVISRQYLLSEWCSREIQMASFRLFDEQKDVLILLFLEEFSSAELGPFYRMRKLVKSRTYLSWTKGRSHRGLFWERVRQALGSGNDPADNDQDQLTAHP